jgi:hypothetical protein
LSESSFKNITPKTHDISLVEKHVPCIEDLAADLEAAVQAVWPRRHEMRYSHVQVLLLSWEDDDLGVASEIKDLRHVFMDIYNYQVQTYEIPNLTPDKAVKRRIFDFLEHDGEETLLIVYYAGHAKRSFQSNEAPIWMA